MGLHYLTTRQIGRVGRAVGKVERDQRVSGPPAPSRQVFDIMVQAVSDIQPNQSGSCYILAGEFGAFHRTYESDGTTPKTVDVYNASDASIEINDEFRASWVISGRSSGSWVATGVVFEEDAQTIYKANIVDGPDTSDDDYEEGENEIYNIHISGDDPTTTVKGYWDWATGGKSWVDGTEIWAKGPDSNGEYQILGGDCRGLID